MNCETSILDILNFIVLTFTFIVIAWYTIIADKQSKELVKQRRLSVIPTLLPEIRLENGNDTFYLTNIGKGIAINIRTKEDKIDPNWYYKFDEIAMLQPSGTKVVNIEHILAGVNKGRTNELAHFKKQIGPSEVSTVIIQFFFQDIEGGNYEQVFQMGDINQHIELKLLKSENWFKRILSQLKNNAG